MCFALAASIATPLAANIKPVSANQATKHGPHTAHHSAALNANLRNGGTNPQIT
jgi:hypothetical protein